MLFGFRELVYFSVAFLIGRFSCERIILFVTTSTVASLGCGGSKVFRVCPPFYPGVYGCSISLFGVCPVQRCRDRPRRYKLGYPSWGAGWSCRSCGIRKELAAHGHAPGNVTRNAERHGICGRRGIRKCPSTAWCMDKYMVNLNDIQNRATCHIREPSES